MVLGDLERAWVAVRPGHGEPHQTGRLGSWADVENEVHGLAGSNGRCLRRPRERHLRDREIDDVLRSIRLVVPEVRLHKHVAGRGIAIRGRMGEDGERQSRRGDQDDTERH